MRTRHLSLRTEQAYLQWLRRYIVFHGRKHPRELGAPEVEQFLAFLAVRRKVSAATQNQALQALLFLCRHVLETELPWLANITRATRPKRLPVVLSRTDAHALLAQLQGAPWLVASLLYGSGLRLMEALRLRIKDIELERGELVVREAKGCKDRGPESKPPRARSASSTFAMSERSPRRVSRKGRRPRSRWPASPSISAWSSNSMSTVSIAVRRQQKAPGKPSPGARVDGRAAPTARRRRSRRCARAECLGHGIGSAHGEAPPYQVPDQRVEALVLAMPLYCDALAPVNPFCRHAS